MNGKYYIEFSLFSNHKAEDTKELVTFFGNIGIIAKGSYGLLYIHDEDKENYNNFQVLSLSRGKITSFIDKLISPYIATVEDFNKELN